LAYNSQPLELNQALDQLASRIQANSLAQIRVEQVELEQALGRILSEDVLAPIDLPPFPASSMDGFAIRTIDLQRSFSTGLRVIGTSLAGHPSPETVEPGTCVRIYTGAQLPAGADLVILQERVANLADDLVQFEVHEPGETYIRPVGHDIQKGSVVVEAGRVVDPFCHGSLSAAGCGVLNVYQPLRVGVFSTGDELVDPGTPAHALQPGQIYDSNRLTVLSLLANTPCSLQDLGRLPDDAETVKQALDDASSTCDVLITSGGVSVGDADFVTDTIKALGELEFWRLNLKPGKPMAFGRIRDCWIFGLPGNPVSTIVTLLLVARPALLSMSGALSRPTPRYTATLTTPLSHSPGRTEFQRGTLSRGELGWQVAHTGDQSSNRLSSFAVANCLIEVAHDRGDLAVGEQVEVLLLDTLY